MGGFARGFDGLAMGVYPWLARLAGYRFRVGETAEIRADAALVLAEVWGPPTYDFGKRYDDATCWIVAYHRAKPVGVMGLMDVQRASHTFDLMQRGFPAELSPRTTREIARLAIVRRHRGGAQVVMVGLLREMLHWSKQNGIEKLLTGSAPALFEVYRRYNPTARLIDPPQLTTEEPARQAQYFAKLRKLGAGDSLVYTFDVAGASPWSVFSRFLVGRLRRNTH